VPNLIFLGVVLRLDLRALGVAATRWVWRQLQAQEPLGLDATPDPMLLGLLLQTDRMLLSYRFF